MAEGYVFNPQGGGPAYPLTQNQFGEAFFPVDSVDPNLLLFGFGVLALFGILGLFAFLASRERK